MIAMQAVLEHSGYRDQIPAGRRAQQRMAVARRLVRDGLTADDVARVWGYAREVGTAPAGLFATWIDRGRVLAKLREARLRGSGFPGAVVDAVPAPLALVAQVAKARAVR